MEQPLVFPTFSNTALAAQPVEAQPVTRPADFLQVIETPQDESRPVITTGVYIATIIGILLMGWFGQLTFRGMAIDNAVEADKITMETLDIRRDTLQIQADVAQRLAPAQLEAAAKQMGLRYGPTPTFVTVQADQHVPASPAAPVILTSAQQPAQPAPGQPAPGQSAPGQPAPAQPAPAQPAPAQPAPVSSTSGD